MAGHLQVGYGNPRVQVWHWQTTGGDNEPRLRGAPVNGIGLASWVWRPVGRAREVGGGDLALAASSASGPYAWSPRCSRPAPAGGLAGAIFVLAMTLPAAWERRAPGAAAAEVGAGAGINELLIGSIRCGPACLPCWRSRFSRGPGCGGATGRRRGAGLGAVTVRQSSTPDSAPGSWSSGFLSLPGRASAGRRVRPRARQRRRSQRRNAELASSVIRPRAAGGRRGPLTGLQGHGRPPSGPNHGDG